MEFGVTEQNSEWDFRVGFRSLGWKFWMERSKCQKGKGNGKYQKHQKHQKSGKLEWEMGFRI